MIWCNVQTNEYGLQDKTYPIICTHHKLHNNKENKFPVFNIYHTTWNVAEKMRVSISPKMVKEIKNYHLSLWSRARLNLMKSIAYYNRALFYKYIQAAEMNNGYYHHSIHCFGYFIQFRYIYSWYLSWAMKVFVIMLPFPTPFTLALKCHLCSVHSHCPVNRAIGRPTSALCRIHFVIAAWLFGTRLISIKIRFQTMLSW